MSQSNQRHPAAYCVGYRCGQAIGATTVATLAAAGLVGFAALFAAVIRGL